MESSRALTFGHQAVHHPLDQLYLVLNGEIDEIRIDQNAVWGAEVRVVRQEESWRVSLP